MIFRLPVSRTAQHWLYWHAILLWTSDHSFTWCKSLVVTVDTHSTVQEGLMKSFPPWQSYVCWTLIKALDQHLTLLWPIIRSCSILPSSSYPVQSNSISSYPILSYPLVSHIIPVVVLRGTYRIYCAVRASYNAEYNSGRWRWRDTVHAECWVLSPSNKGGLRSIRRDKKRCYVRGSRYWIECSMKLF